MLSRLACLPEVAPWIRSMASKKAQGPPEKKRKLPPIKEPGAGTLELGDGASVVFKPGLFPAAEAAAFYRQLQTKLLKNKNLSRNLHKDVQEAVAWQQREVRILGKPVLQPRLIAYQADDSSLQYTYSGATLQPEPWSEEVLRVKEVVERETSQQFNSCLLNYYRTGSDSLNWHSDNERLYGATPTIASVSFGTPRDFLLRRNADPTDKYRFNLGPGSLLVMRGTLQQHWVHSVPKRKGVEGGRINLTFRQIVEPEGAAGGGRGRR